jgi:endoribonuclease Dicer
MADTVVVMVHGIAVTEPILARTKAVSKALAAELALKVLDDDSSDHHLLRLCDCNVKGTGVNPQVETVRGEGEEEEEDAEGGSEERVEDPAQEDETEGGFAALAQRLVSVRGGGSLGTESHCRESSDMDISEDEVEVR